MSQHTNCTCRLRVLIRTQMSQHTNCTCRLCVLIRTQMSQHTKCPCRLCVLIRTQMSQHTNCTCRFLKRRSTFAARAEWFFAPVDPKLCSDAVSVVRYGTKVMSVDSGTALLKLVLENSGRAVFFANGKHYSTAVISGPRCMLQSQGRRTSIFKFFLNFLISIFPAWNCSSKFRISCLDVLPVPDMLCFSRHIIRTMEKGVL